jgi:hypothetical protein
LFISLPFGWHGVKKVVQFKRGRSKLYEVMKKPLLLLGWTAFFISEHYAFALSLPNNFSNSPLFLAVGSGGVSVFCSG